MKWFLSLVAVVLVSALCAGASDGQTIPGGLYFGQDPPGFSPVVFAPGVISLTGRYEYGLVFSPSMDECVVGATNGTWSIFNLFYSRMASDSTWSDFVPAPFQGDGDACFPFFSASGSEIYFVSSRPQFPPARIWGSAREGADWGPPFALPAPVYSGQGEWGSSLTGDGTLFFSSERAGGLGIGDIYRANTAPGGEVTVESLGAAVNSTGNDGSACIARDGSYLIFESTRPGGYGQSDLWITFNEDGTWTEPRNLGSGINTSQIEDGCFLSPDGKYLFFNRRRAYYTGERSDIWWVDAQAVFHPEASGVIDPGGSMKEAPILRVEPNPFGLSTSITYSLPSSGFVALNVYDALGRRVRSLVHATLEAGTHSVTFDDPSREGPAGGVYYCSLQVGDKRLKTTKMVSLR